MEFLCQLQQQQQQCTLLSGEKRHGALKLATPSNSTTNHHGEISTNRAFRVLAVTMGCITVSSEDVRAKLTRVSQLVFQCSFEVTEKMFDCLPVLGAKIGAKACKKRHNISNVCSSHSCKILEGANGREVWNRAHELYVRIT